MKERAKDGEKNGNKIKKKKIKTRQQQKSVKDTTKMRPGKKGMQDIEVEKEKKMEDEEETNK